MGVIPLIQQTLSLLDGGIVMSLGGQTASDLMTLNSVLTAGLLVSSQNNNTTWIQGDEQITWDVANTDSAPVNCLKVNILFSAIGVFTDTIILAGNADNNGSKNHCSELLNRLRAFDDCR
jgi:hypothetical protein